MARIFIFLLTFLSMAPGAFAGLCSPGQEWIASKYSPSGGSCQSCMPGYFSAGGSNVSCSQCKTGSIAPSWGTIACTACPSGQISDYSGVQCSPVVCIAGQGLNPLYPNLGIASLCVACPAGTYATKLNGGTICSPCDANQYSATTGAIACTPCGPGTKSWKGATSCYAIKDCGANTYQDAKGNCSSCTNTQLAIEGGCKYCPAGTMNSPLGAICTACGFGKVRAENDNPCHSCTYGNQWPNDNHTSCVNIVTEPEESIE